MAKAAQKQGWQRFARAALLGWHLCSLDAPTVALLWAALLARLARVPLQPSELLVLGLGTWIVYVLDRVLDGVATPGRRAVRGPGQGASQDHPGASHLRPRHHFHRRHKRKLLWLCGLASVLLALLCRRLPARLVVFYLLLAVPVAAYGLRVHWRLLRPARATQSEMGIGKEAAVGLLFTAAVAAPALVSAPPDSRPALLAASLLLAGLCWLNCMLISHAEADRPRETHRRERQQLARRTVTLALAATAVYLSGSGRSAAAAVLLSCLFLLTLLLSPRDSRANPLRFRVLSDVGLLTPLLFLLPRA
jgi:hypothetical protein